MPKPLRLVIVESSSEPGFLSVRMADGDGALSTIAFKAALVVAGYEPGDVVELHKVETYVIDGGAL